MYPKKIQTLLDELEDAAQTGNVLYSQAAETIKYLYEDGKRIRKSFISFAKSTDDVLDEIEDKK